LNPQSTGILLNLGDSRPPAQQQPEQQHGTNTKQIAPDPMEICQEMFTYILPAQFHVCPRDDKLCLSICLEPDKDNRSSCSLQEATSYLYNGDERNVASPYGYPISDPRPCEERVACSEARNATYARRPQSTWGPHWMCEEGAQKSYSSAKSLLLVCRKM
jgi:hypothetical protein